MTAQILNICKGTKENPGKIEGNVVFTYLDVFAKDSDFEKYLPEYKNLDELKEHYRKGGLGDSKIKNFYYYKICDSIISLDVSLENTNDITYTEPRILNKKVNKK